MNDENCKAMNFKIHRGTKEIGGSCVEVWTDTSRIVIDIGMPLVNPDKTPFDEKKTENQSREKLISCGILPDIPSLYLGASNTALLISHAHKDHYGLLRYVHPSIEVWLGIGTKILIEISNAFGDEDWKIENYHHLKHDKQFSLGDFKMTPYLMDHSGFDAYAFLIEANGKSLFYSGDFRIHGRKSAMFNWFMGNIKKNIDYLLLEGSTIGRTIMPFKTEDELEEEFVTVFKQTKGINLVYCSGQNIDRLVTIYRACKKTGKTFLIDFYTANVLRNINKRVNSSIPFPSKTNFPEINVYYPHFLTNRVVSLGKKEETIIQFLPHKFDKNKLNDLSDKLVMLVRPSCKYDVEHFLHNLSDGCFIYSMYHGYKESNLKTKKFLDFITGKGMPIVDLHTSGHADLNVLKKMAAAVNPKNIVPIHTFEADRYADILDAYHIVNVNDKETIKI